MVRRARPPGDRPSVAASAARAYIVAMWQQSMKTARYSQAMTVIRNPRRTAAIERILAR